jgi:hypothetical protein
MDLFPSSGEWRETAILLGPLEQTSITGSLALSKGPNRVVVSLRSAEDGNRSSFWNVMVSSYLELRTMDEVQKPGDCFTSSSERFTF